MYGRFAVDAKTDERIQEFVAGDGDPQDWWKEWHGSYSIAPTDLAPIIDRGRDRARGSVEQGEHDPTVIAPRPPGTRTRTTEPNGWLDTVKR